MKKTYYEKRGRRYVPVAEYDNDLLDSYPKGAHLVMCVPGGVSRVFNINPDYAALIAAAKIAEDAISNVIVTATSLRLNSQDRGKQLTPEQLAAWEQLVRVLGPGAKQLEWPSAREAAQAAAAALIEQANKLLTYPAAKEAHEHFLSVCALTRPDAT